MRHALLPRTTLLVALALTAIACSRSPVPVTLSYFYFPGCPTCPETARLEALAGELHGIARSREGTTVNTYDIRGAEEWDVLRRYAAQYEVDADELRFPILFAEGEVHDGFQAIEEYLETR